MTPFENLAYLSVGIAFSFSVQTSTGFEFSQVREPIIAPIPSLYSQDYSPLSTSSYSVKDYLGFPKRNYMQRYKAIAESSWFERAYKGKSLGDYIEVDN